MKLTNKQKGHILLIPIYLIVACLIMLLCINFVIALLSTPTNELIWWVLDITIIIMTIYGIHYLAKE